MFGQKKKSVVEIIISCCSYIFWICQCSQCYILDKMAAAPALFVTFKEKQDMVLTYQNIAGIMETDLGQNVKTIWHSNSKGDYADCNNHIK